jgi:HlyD family secretion protein
MKKRNLIILVVLLIIGGAIWFLIQPKPFLYVGTIEATEINMPARVSSTITHYYVHTGYAINRGETLVTLDPSQYQLNVDKAENNYKRALPLIKSGSISSQVFINDKIALKQAELLLSWCTITSPIHGFVLEKYHHHAEWVNPGESLLTIADLTHVWCMVYVPETLLARLSLNQKVTSFLPEAPHHIFKGWIERINDYAEFTPTNAQTMRERSRLVYGIKVMLNNPHTILKPGMAIEIQLHPTRLH